jgi:competence protein ComEC
MAISGLHIGLAALFMFFIGRFIWSRSAKLSLLMPAQQAGAITALSAAIIYALLAGLSLPTQRALIMTLTVLSGLILSRRFFSQDILALSLLFILLHDPFAVLSAGFWLSFFAVALIFFLSQNRFPPPRLQWLSIHICLAVGLAPLTLLFFQQVSLISPFANLIAVPLVSFLIVPLSLLATALLFLAPKAAELVFFIADQCLNYLWQFLSFLSGLPISHWQSAALPEWTIVLSVIMLAFLLVPRGVPARWLGLVFLLPALLFQPARPEHNHFDLTVLDVGQGLASVVITANHVLVFDTGRYYSKRFDMGRAVVIPFLNRHHVQQIDTLIISHNDIDHSGGTSSVLDGIPTSQLLTSDLKQYYPQANQCLQGQHWQWDGVEFEILNPKNGQQGSDNNRSCVLKIHSPTMSALLTGDIEHETEIELEQTQADKLRADILVVPHHGSRSSSSEAFIQAVSPTIASVSVGYRNAYDFPAKEVIDRYRQFGSQIVRTDHSGAQIYHYDASKGLEVAQWRDINHRLWSSTSTE